MICSKDDPIELSEDKLLDALKQDGEFFLLKLHYDDFEDEKENMLIKYKISQALNVIVSYEDDGTSYNNIEKFVKYIYEISDDKQISIFGIKKVKKLSEFPIKILFAGILPINQLKMKIGKKVDELIESDKKYFKLRFKKLRDDVSKEIGVNILPLFPICDTQLDEYKVNLSDPLDNRIISEFELPKEISKETLEIYLLKLFYIYKVLAEQKINQNMI
jgi:hypothetical protein